MTSPEARVPRAHQVMRLTESLMNLTLPSENTALTPPGCALLAGMEKLPSMPQSSRQPNRQPLPRYWTSLGVWKWLNIVMPAAPCAQPIPRLLWSFFDVPLKFAEQVARSARILFLLL